MPGDTGTMGVSSIRLAAVWTHRVVYDLDGGSGEPPATQQVPEEQGFEVSSAVPFRGGYAFKGWSDGTTTYQPGSDATMGKSDIVLTAVWDRSVIPIFPDDQDDPIEVFVEKESEPRLGKDAKNVLLIAIAVAIIAELAVLNVSRKR